MSGLTRTRRGRARGDEGVSAILGGILMLALMMTLVPGAILLREAMSDEMAAQREAAERAAFCARHPHSKVMDCKGMGPLPGYRCEETATDVFLCMPEAAPLPDPALATPSAPAPSPLPTVPSAPTVATPPCVDQDAADCVPQGHVEM